MPPRLEPLVVSCVAAARLSIFAALRSAAMASSDLRFTDAGRWPIVNPSFVRSTLLNQAAGLFPSLSRPT
jgi:hypothetical protein